MINKDDTILKTRKTSKDTIFRVCKHAICINNDNQHERNNESGRESSD